MTVDQQAQHLEDLEKEAAEDNRNTGMLVAGSVLSLLLVICGMYAWKKGGKRKQEGPSHVNPLTDSRKTTISRRLSGIFTSSRTTQGPARKTELVAANEELDVYVSDTKTLPRNHMMKSNWTYYEDDKALDKMEESGPLAHVMDVEMLYKDNIKIDREGTLVEFNCDASPVQAFSNLPLPPCLLICAEITIMDFHNGELAFGLSFAPQVKGSWPGGFPGTVGYRSQGVINNGTTKSWTRSKCGGYAAGDVITIMISRDFNERTLQRRARVLNPEACQTFSGETPSRLTGTPMSRSMKSPSATQSTEWDKDNLPPRGFGALLFLKNGLPCQDLPLIMPELRMPKLKNEFMPETRESVRNCMVSGEHDVDTPWADLPALFISIACDSKAKVKINLGQSTFNFMESDLYQSLASGVTMEGMHDEITQIMGNGPREFTQGLAADLQLEEFEEYRIKFNEVAAKANEPVSPSEQRAIESNRRKMKAFVKIAAMSGSSVKDIDIENPDPAKLRALMSKVKGKKPVKVEYDENRCRFYRNGEKCDCPTYERSDKDLSLEAGEDHEICVCGHHKMYHRPDLNEQLSTQERPMWYMNDDAPEFWEREEAKDVLQELAMESMVSQTRWRTITDPNGEKCFYNLKTGETRYNPPKAVPWRYAAETFAQAFPPLDNDEQIPRKGSTDKSGSPMLKQKTKGKTRRMKTLKKQPTSDRLLASPKPPGAVSDPSEDDDDDDDGLPPTRTLRVSRDPKGSARYVARARNDITTQRYIDRKERREKSMPKANFSAAMDFRELVKSR
jgi:hypothetical protein